MFATPVFIARRLTLLAAALVAGVVTLARPSAALADGFIVVPVPPGGAGSVALPPGHPPYAPLAVEYHKVGVRIDDQVAVTTVDQAFRNPSDQRLEGTYIFPLPEGASIDRFAMDVNGKEMEAELLDADKARKVYEDIVRSMRDPALMEYVGRGMIKVRIFPIEPRSTKRIALKYTQLLKSDSGLVHYSYPLNTEKFSSAPIRQVSLSCQIVSRRAIKSLYSPSHAVEIKRHGDKRAVVGFEMTDARPDTDFALYFDTAAKPGDSAPEGSGGIGLSLLTYAADKAVAGEFAGGYFLLLASPGFIDDTAAAMPKDVVFVLDTSGSMAGKKLEQAKRALTFCVENLSDKDRFEIVRFSTEAEPLFGKLVEADAAHRSQAVSFVQGLKPIGGTAIHDAVATAIDTALRQEDRQRVCNIIFLTDGRPTVGQTDEDPINKLLDKRASRPIRLFPFGIGTDVNTHLLDKLAATGRTFSQYVLPEEDIEVKLSGFFTKIAHPAMVSPKLSVIGQRHAGEVRVSQLYPVALPDLYIGDQLVLLGRYDGRGGAEIELTGTVGPRERTITCQANFPDASSKPGPSGPDRNTTHSDQTGDTSFIPKLWATRRVGYLLEEIRLRGESAELRDEATRLARQFGIVTPYTSYLIVEDEARRNVPMPARTMQELERDTAARADAAAAYRENMAKSGAGAVGGSAASGALKLADAVTAPMAANQATAEAGPVGQQALRVQNHQAQRFVAGRNFYQNGELWIDGLAQNSAANQNLRRVQVAFASKEYFALLDKHPLMQRWLSVGQNVDVVLEDTVFEVR